MKEFCSKKNLFGKEAELVINGIDPSLCKELIEGAYDYGLGLQKIFNFFDENSELSKLNKKREMSVSNGLLHVIKNALKLCELTKGEYSINIGKQIIQRKKSIQITPINCSYKNIEIKGNRIILTHKDVLVDLGSIAKGYIVDKMVEYLISEGILSGLIDAGGDIRVFGNKPEFIDIQHPREKDKIIHTIKLKNSSVATSGDYSQYYGSYEKPHIINKKNLISVTVTAPSLEEADVYATALFVLNKKETGNIINKNKKIKVMTVDSDLNVRFFNGFKNLIYWDKK